MHVPYKRSEGALWSEGLMVESQPWGQATPSQIRPLLTHLDTCTEEAKGPAGHLMPGGGRESGNRVPSGPTVSGAP